MEIEKISRKELRSLVVSWWKKMNSHNLIGLVQFWIQEQEFCNSRELEKILFAAQIDVSAIFFQNRLYVACDGELEHFVEVWIALKVITHIKYFLGFCMYV